MDNPKRSVCFVIILGIFLAPICVHAGKPDETPLGLLHAIKQRNEELDKRAKELSLKEQRLRILEQEVTEKLKKISETREEVKKREASEMALAAKRAAEEKAIAAKKEAADKTIAEAERMKKEAEEKAVAAADKAKRGAGKKGASPPPLKKGVAGKTVSLEEEDNVDPELAQKEADRKQVQDGRFSNLAKVYESMPPEEAALRLQNMKEAYAMEILPRMKVKKAAKVLSAMDPVVAAKYSEKMGSP